VHLKQPIRHATNPAARLSSAIGGEMPAAFPISHRDSASRLLSPLDEIAVRAPDFLVRCANPFEIDGERYELPSYEVIGPESDHAPVRLAIFAGLHGDELEGTLALIFFAQLLEAVPDLARGYSLLLYPLCNPTGYEDGTHLTRQGFNLSEDFGRGSPIPEVSLLEGGCMSQSFDGIITLHSNGTENTFVAGSPQPDAAKRFVPPVLRAVEDFAVWGKIKPVLNPAGYHARNGKGSISAALSKRDTFELTLEAPNAAAAWLLSALLAILKEKNKFNAFRTNLG